jgi:hypothetical protein
MTYFVFVIFSKIELYNKEYRNFLKIPHIFFCYSNYNLRDANLETHKLCAGTVTLLLLKYTNALQIPQVHGTSKLFSLGNVSTLHCLRCSMGTDNAVTTDELAHSFIAFAVSLRCMQFPRFTGPSLCILTQ